MGRGVTLTVFCWLKWPLAAGFGPAASHPRHAPVSPRLHGPIVMQRLHTALYLPGAQWA